MNKYFDFPCTACGECCRRISQNEQTADLDRGDGTCRYFDDETRLCRIYAERPLICRVEDYYRTYLSEQMDWDQFVRINLEICHKFQSEK